jgi:hypothetical protein
MSQETRKKIGQAMFIFSVSQSFQNNDVGCILRKKLSRGGGCTDTVPQWLQNVFSFENHSPTQFHPRDMCQSELRL